MAAGILHAKENRRRFSAEGSVDYPFLILVLLALTVGLTMLYSASFAQSAYDTGYRSTTRYLSKQAVCAGIGLVAMVLFSHVPAAVWYRLAWPLYLGSIALLLSVLVVGESVNGAKRWIHLGGIQFQPSELAKFTMILMFGRLTRNYGQRVEHFRWGVLGFGMTMLGILVPLALEKHLSAIMLMGMVGVVMMFVAASGRSRGGGCLCGGLRQPYGLRRKPHYGLAPPGAGPGGHGISNPPVPVCHWLRGIVWPWIGKKQAEVSLSAVSI